MFESESRPLSFEKSLENPICSISVLESRNNSTLHLSWGLTSPLHLFDNLYQNQFQTGALHIIWPKLESYSVHVILASFSLWKIGHDKSMQPTSRKSVFWEWIEIILKFTTSYNKSYIRQHMQPVNNSRTRAMIACTRKNQNIWEILRKWKKITIKGIRKGRSILSVCRPRNPNYQTFRTHKFCNGFECPNALWISCDIPPPGKNNGKTLPCEWCRRWILSVIGNVWLMVGGWDSICRWTMLEICCV